MSHKPWTSEECCFKGRRERAVHLLVVRPSASEAGEPARGAHHGRVIAAGRAQQTGIMNGKVWYYADFAIYGALVVALSALALGERRSDQMIWLAAASAGAGS